MTAAFLSHSSRDKPVARRIARRLAHRGASVWLDENELQLGDRLPQLLRERIAATPFFLVLASDSARDSSWVRAEIEAASSAEDTVVIPLFPSGVDPWGLLADRKGLTLELLSFEAAMDALARTILGDAAPREHDLESLRRDLDTLRMESPELVRSVEAAISAGSTLVNVSPEDYASLETLLWVSYELADTAGRQHVARAAADLFRQHGIGYELISHFLGSNEDHTATLNALCQAIARPELITPAFRLLDRLAVPSDLHYRWLLVPNIREMNDRQLDEAVRFTTRPMDEDESVIERMFLADVLYQHRPQDERLKSFWVLRAYAATAKRYDELRILVLTLNDAVAGRQFQYNAATDAFRSRARNLARSHSWSDRADAVRLLLVARDNKYVHFDELQSELQRAPGSAEWNSPETSTEFQDAYRRAVYAICDDKPDVYDVVSVLLTLAVGPAGNAQGGDAQPRGEAKGRPPA